MFTYNTIDSNLAIPSSSNFFVGENGCGKSTLLESMAQYLQLNGEGGSKNFCFTTYEQPTPLTQAMTISRSVKKPSDMYFFRAETFYNVVSEIERLDKEPGGGTLIKSYYGDKNLHTISHGESFFQVFQHRFVGNGLYILDEPESALSPQRQLQFLVRLHELVQQNCQFIIATHSPIIMTYPNAWVYEFRENRLHKTLAKETDHYLTTQSFFTHTERVLQYLL